MKNRLGFALALVALCACDDGSDGSAPATTTTSVTATTSTSATTTSSSSTSSSSTSSTVSAPTTTTTVSTTTNFPPSSTTTTTTTTTIFDCTVLVEVVFAVTNNETLGALQYDTAYPQPGTFLGSAGSVFCSKLAGDFASFNDVDAEARLVTAIIAASGFIGPVDVATCEFCTVGAPPAPDDFVVTIVDQSRPDFSPANATVAVTQVIVIPGPSTTTTLSP